MAAGSIPENQEGETVQYPCSGQNKTARFHLRERGLTRLIDKILKAGYSLPQGDPKSAPHFRLEYWRIPIGFTGEEVAGLPS